MLLHTNALVQDEIFHVRQTQTYCDGRFARSRFPRPPRSILRIRFNDWDEKITTLPGLYIFTIFVLRLGAGLMGQRLTSASALCSLGSLRAVNLLFAMMTVCLSFLLLLRLQPRTATVRHLLLKTLEMTLHPLLFFFFFLFYTDAGSTFFVLLLLHLALSQQNSGRDGGHVPAALAGAVAVLFRQTNVVWVLFVLATAVLRWFEQGRLSNGDASLGKEVFQPTQIEHCARFVHSASQRLHLLCAVPRALAVFVKQALRNLPRCCLAPARRILTA